MEHFNPIEMERRPFMEQYIKIVPGDKNKETLYYLKSEGEKLVNLMYYFRDYYKKYNNESLNNY
ncbi:MAG: hypothetical protein ACFFCE_00050 [Promethearchaeota archaeon]